MIFPAIKTAVKLWPVRPFQALYIMPRRHTVSAKIFRHRQQVFEFHRLITAHTGDGRSPFKISIGKVLYDLFFEIRLVIQNIMRKAHHFGHALGVIYILPRTTGFCFLYGRAVIIQLKRHANNLIALPREHRRADRAIHAAAHRDNNAGLSLGLIKA